MRATDGKTTQMRKHEEEKEHKPREAVVEHEELENCKS